MKKNSTLINELREELRYAQMMVRIETRGLARSRARCYEIAAKMRALQEPIKQAAYRPDWRPEKFDAKDFEQKEML